MSTTHIDLEGKDEHDPVNGSAQAYDRCAIYAVVDVLIENGTLDLKDYHRAFYRLLAELDQFNTYGDTLNEKDFKATSSLVSKEDGLADRSTYEE